MLVAAQRRAQAVWVAQRGTPTRAALVVHLREAFAALPAFVRTR